MNNKTICIWEKECDEMICRECEYYSPIDEDIVIMAQFETDLRERVSYYSEMINEYSDGNDFFIGG